MPRGSERPEAGAPPRQVGQSSHELRNDGLHIVAVVREHLDGRQPRQRHELHQRQDGLLRGPSPLAPLLFAAADIVAEQRLRGTAGPI